MDAVLFNAHDLILAMTAFLCVTLAFIYLLLQKQAHPTKPLLVGFLLAHTFMALHELSYYGVQFRYTVFELSPNLFFIGSFAYCIDALLLFLFTKAAVYRDFRLHRKQLVHLLPLVGFLAYMIFNYYSLDVAEKRSAIWDWTLSTSWHFVTVELIVKLLRIGYGIGCLILISRYHDRLMEKRADISMLDLGWLKTLVIGFMCVMAADLVLAVIKAVALFVPIDISFLSSFGVSTYYATFFLLLALLMYTVARLSRVEPILMGHEETPVSDASISSSDFVTHIEHYMQQEKPYLDSEITLDELASALGVSAKTLSVTLNHHFQMNFYEFINRYRIEEAKQLLSNNQSMTITEIYYQVGFNSKSVFYTFFKKCEGMTPSAYRKQCADGTAASA